MDDADCDVIALSTQEATRVPFSLYNTRLLDLQTEGGSRAFLDLDSGPAIRAALLQGPDLGLTADRERALLLSKEEQIAKLLCEWVSRLNVDRSAGAPKLYKPAVLTAVIDAIEADEITDHRIHFQTVLPRFLAKMDSLGIPAGKEQAVQAFCNLTRDLLWGLAHFDLTRLVDFDNVSSGTCAERVSHAAFKEPFGWLLRNAAAWWPRTTRSTTPIHFWWVNQGSADEKERALGTIWCPQIDKAGKSQPLDKRVKSPKGRHHLPLCEGRNSSGLHRVCRCGGRK